MNNIAAERAPRYTTYEGTKERNTSTDGSRVADHSQRDVAQYLADMILELRNMAKSAKLARVMVPLEFAYYEAFNVANAVKVPPEEIERIKELAEAAREFEQQELG